MEHLDLTFQKNYDMLKLNIDIKPIVSTEDRQLWIMTGEINSMDPSEIQDGIDSCQMAINGDIEEISWGWEVFELLIHKETATLEYHGEFVEEIPTQDILRMLQDYKRALEYFDSGH